MMGGGKVLPASPASLKKKMTHRIMKKFDGEWHPASKVASNLAATEAVVEILRRGEVPMKWKEFSLSFKLAIRAVSDCKPNEQRWLIIDKAYPVAMVKIIRINNPNGVNVSFNDYHSISCDWPRNASSNCDLRIFPDGPYSYVVVDKMKKELPPKDIGKRSIHFCDPMYRLDGACCGCGLNRPRKRPLYMIGGDDMHRFGMDSESSDGEETVEETVQAPDEDVPEVPTQLGTQE